MRIAIVDYDPAWPGLFERAKAELGDALADARPRIEHVGSTAVPGLPAKPVIDVMVGLPGFWMADSLVPRIAALGYEYDSSFEHVFPRRRFFRRISEGKATHHVHMVEEGGGFWERHLLFRDYLRAHPEAGRRYADLKRNLAEAEWESGAAYSEAKTAFIRDVERRAAEEREA